MPGKRSNFIKLLFEGQSQGDGAVVVVSGKPTGSAMRKIAIEAKTREQLFLAYTMGIMNIVIVISRMEKTFPVSHSSYPSYHVCLSTVIFLVGQSERRIPQSQGQDLGDLERDRLHAKFCRLCPHGSLFWGESDGLPVSLFSLLQSLSLLGAHHLDQHAGMV